MYGILNDLQFLLAYFQAWAHTAAFTWNGFPILTHSASTSVLLGKCLCILLGVLIFCEAIGDSLGCVRFSSVVHPQYSVLHSVIIFRALSAVILHLCFTGSRSSFLRLPSAPSTCLAHTTCEFIKEWG